MVTWDDFDKIWASTSPLTPYEFSDPNYSQGWNFVGSTPPARQMWDSIQKKNDEKFKYLRDNFGTPNIVTSSSQMTDTDKVYVYMGSEAGWNNGHWYYYNEGTSSWEDGGVYNSVAFVTDTTLSIAGQPADAKATGDALALKADLAGCTFTGNVSVNADFSVTGDSTLTGNVSASGDVNATGGVTADNISATTNGTIGGALSVAGASTLTGNVSAGADITVVGDVSSANIIASNNANIGGNATVTGSVASASLTTTADGTIGGNLSVSGTTTLTGDVSASADLSVAGDSSLTNLSVSGTTALAGTSTAPTPSADDNSTKIATTEYVQKEIKPIETDVTINDKRITNIEKLLQGNLYDYQTDSSSAYTKTVPSGAMPYAGIEQIGGKTVVWNQLADNMPSGSGTYIDVITYKANEDGTITLNGTASADASITICNITLLANHKYILRGCPSGGDSTKYYYGFGNEVNDTGSGYYYTVGASNESKTLNFTVKQGAFFDYTKLGLMLHDVTLMFGSGNEPTISEFNKMFPAYYTNNTGTLLSAGVTFVESSGRNQISTADIEQGSITSHGGTNLASSIRLRTKGYIPVKPNATYTISCKANHSASDRVLVMEVENYGIYNGYIGFTSINAFSANYTVPSDVYYIRILYKKYNNSSIVLSELQEPFFAEGSNVPYIPYKSPVTYPIPPAIRNLEGYGWSCPTTYNYIDFERKVFVKNVGGVNLGSLTWEQRNTVYGNKRYTTVDLENEIKYGTHGVAPNYIISNVYYPSSDTYIEKEGINIYDGLVLIYDSTKNNLSADDFKTAVNGVYMYFELATPQEIDISEYLTDDYLIQVESGGTLTFPNQNGTDYQIPVPSEEEYMIDLQSAL